MYIAYYNTDLNVQSTDINLPILMKIQIDKSAKVNKKEYKVQ